MGGPFMMNLKVAVEFMRPLLSHAFCVVPRIVRDESAIAVLHELLGSRASPAPPPVHVESESVVTRPDSPALLQHVYFAERYWRSSIRKNSAPVPRRELRWSCIRSPPVSRNGLECPRGSCAPALR